MQSNFIKHPRTHWILLFVLLASGLGIRLYDLLDPPLDIHPTRQLHSALMARGLYYQHVTDAPEWMIKTAILQGKREAVIEPPIIETVTAWFYLLSGGENIWFARIFSSVWWIIGGYFLYRLAAQMTSSAGGLVSTALYLFLPYAVQTSRTFQPDPMMVALIVTSWWTFVNWRTSPTWKNALALGIASGAAIFVKNIAIFWLAFPYIINLADHNWLKTLRSKQIWMISFLALLPAAIYTIYGTYIAGFLSQQFSFRFFPELWISLPNYARWFQQIQDTAGIGVLIIALCGIWLYFRTAHRNFVIGMWAGYIIYGMTFAYHIGTHDYYQLPLITLLSLCIAPLGSLLSDEWLKKNNFSQGKTTLIILFILSVSAMIWMDRSLLKQNNFTPEVKFWESLGDDLRGEPVIGLTQDYGYRMAYYGWNSIENWSSSGDLALRDLAGKQKDISVLIENQTKGKKYFLVTWFDDYKRQTVLQSFLAKYVRTESDGYALYHLLEPVQ